MIEVIGNLEGTITNNAPLTGNLTKAIEYVEPTTQQKTATPTKQEQVITPDEGIFALSKVTINPIGDEYIIPSGTLNITEEGTFNVKNNEYANVSLINKWAELGYPNEPQCFNDMYNVAKEIYDNWDSSITSMRSKYYANHNIVVFPLVDTSNVTTMYEAFQSCQQLRELPLLNTSNVTTLQYAFNYCINLKSIPQFDTSNVTIMYETFKNCTNLENIPVLNTSKVTTMQGCFTSCTKLTNESINNILKMCINATSYARTKTLSYMGLSSSYYPSSMIQSLSNYQDFISAGWSIGY